jgi:hypothetical protein
VTFSQTYYHEVQAIIYVIDTTDHIRMAVCKVGAEKGGG